MGADASNVDFFFRDFAQALVEGQSFAVTRPLSAKALAELEGALRARPSVVEGLEQAVSARVRRLVPAAQTGQLRDAELRLLVAAHQLLFAAHAATERGQVSSARLASLGTDMARLLAPCRLLVDPAGALFAHVVLDAVVRAERVDHHVAFNVGSKRFYGELPRFLAVPLLRGRGQVATSSARVIEKVHGKHGPALEVLFSKAPLSRLLLGPGIALAPSLRGLADALGDRDVCRWALHELAWMGLDGWAQWVVEGFQAWREAPPATPAAVVTVARFIVTASMWEAIIGSKPASRGWPETFASLVGAWMKRQDLLEVPELDRRDGGAAAALDRVLAISSPANDREMAELIDTLTATPGARLASTRADRATP